MHGTLMIIFLKKKNMTGKIIADGIIDKICQLDHCKII